MKWSTIKTLALIGLAALVLWYIGASMDLLAGLGLGGWLERERDRQSNSNDVDAPNRPPAEEAETSSAVGEAARQHSKQVETPPPEADSPSQLFEQQAEEL